ncbi:hypothetical protein [Streptomyces sp. HNM0574]|uniref:hypothetical protein n=1 Tax=Streptomyces sp. HNM0574 TaxID=2714954 RepID=UPI00146E2480|nr:hypothetical protein [Streptomyces sp. HNM0574]NLU67025.1 hypothetical protein [Streptomyces sp. HNM0574]
MSAPVVVHPPVPEGGRRVTARGEFLGTAYGMVDLIEFLRRAGLDLATIDLHDKDLIDWQGGGPETWEPET